ncbi:DUF5069 domain-containing protein [Persicirhabdus sediminis]|uniref:DUF5069 domain-containing protein n=1 Tax=Persicirhabdus sediminis TaxID=454144 RepID=A0A8J7M9X8_9BACT|nr:DUF5069 domain-containing protein [Persicirhabdus sediminis]MBK1789624.1 DUF5069 domain-containing protein [Persicirhabdus sediminis]
MTWNDQFLELFDRCLQKYLSGNTDFTSYYTDNDLLFLESIGYKQREFFDFVEDFGDAGVPSMSTALLIAAVRRDFLTVVQDGTLSDKEITRDQLPGKSEQLDGIAYLPRIIAKAKAKLAGELDPDIMFSCGGDRRFLSANNLHPADFLRNVWAAGDDTQRIADYVKAASK